MRQTAIWISSVILLGAALSPAWSQDRRGFQDRRAPAAPLDATGQVAQQISLLKALNPINLTGEQIQALLNVLKPAVEKQAQQEQVDGAQLAAVVQQLRQALPQAAAAPGQTTPAELELRRVEQMGNQSRERVRGQLRGELRTLLEKLLSPPQQTAMIATNHSMNLQRRIQEMQTGDRGLIDREARTLDQLRRADARRYAEERQNFAMRQADVFGGGQGFRGGDRGGQGFQGRGGQGAQGRGGQGGAENRRQQDGLRQEQMRLRLQDPAVQARMQPFLALADQVRRMPEPTYQQQRLKLALQMWQTREERRVQTNPQEAIDSFITRILLAPGAVEVLEMKQRAAGVG